MSLLSWRNTAIVLAVICSVQRWQSCSHAAPTTAAAAADTAASDPHHLIGATTAARPAPALPADATAASGPESAAAPGKSFHGFRIPACALRLTPQRGETLRAYRDRILPLAELAIAPQRARVARTRDDFANLDAHQRAELDAAVAAAAAAIQDRVAAALARGELRPATFKPMTGVALARDVLDIVDRGNTRFTTVLTLDQRSQLASHRFDFADYLVFTARWEAALHAPGLRRARLRVADLHTRDPLR